jgi:hypothetical protein
MRMSELTGDRTTDQKTLSVALTTAAPAGFVMKACNGCTIPEPDGSLASASTYGFPDSNPVTATTSTCTRP